MAEQNWQSICKLADINVNTGVCALHNGEQVAIFKIGGEQQLFAVQNYCPFGEANVLSRGLVGDVNGDIVVASPLYKQQFKLSSGACIEDDSVSLKTYAVREHNGVVQLKI